ncbi:MAG TPA: hypothetical protein VKP10_03340 [Gemmatimonadales bacterium]|nr:hypothetical protein [Gemmatimonadales bacterium]
MPNRPLPACLALFAALGCAESAGPVPDRRFTSAAAGNYHTCALTASRTAYCWGRNTNGALGDGTTQASAVPVRVATSIRFVAIIAGFDYSCGLAAGGVAYCWGDNFNGQLGDGTTTNRTTPVAVSGGLAFRSLSAGEAHTCGVTVDGASYCWGAPIGPAPGGGVLPNQLSPTPLAGPTFAEVSAGYEIACAITAAGAPYCWGLYPPGVTFADSSVPSAAEPLPVSGSVTLRTISAGHKHACGLDSNGRAYCWGENVSGQVGNGSHDYAPEPVPVSGDIVFAALSAHGPGHNCGVTPAHLAWCWGANAFGQLGTSSDSSSAIPARVVGGLAFVSISAGFGHTCGVTTGGKIYCWGYGAFGQLGAGAFADARHPQAVGN